jgi:hypothetical protein
LDTQYEKRFGSSLVMRCVLEGSLQHVTGTAYQVEHHIDSSTSLSACCFGPRQAMRTGQALVDGDERAWTRLVELACGGRRPANRRLRIDMFAIVAAAAEQVLGRETIAEPCASDEVGCGLSNV